MIFIAIQVLYPLVISFPECRMRHCISFWLPISFCEDFFSHSTPLGTWLESSIRLYTFILCCHLFGILAHTKTVFVNFALLAVFFLRRWLTWLWYWNNFVGQYLYLKWAAANAAASTSASKNCAPKCVCFLFSLVRYFNFRLVEKKNECHSAERALEKHYKIMQSTRSWGRANRSRWCCREKREIAWGGFVIVN